MIRQAVLGDAYMTEIETGRQITLQATSHPFTANVDSQDTPTGLTASASFRFHILTANGNK